MVTERQWPAPSYASIYTIVRSLDPAMVTLAQDGAAAFRDRYELVYRHRAGHPNSIWQADHTQDQVRLKVSGLIAGQEGKC